MSLSNGDELTSIFTFLCKGSFDIMAVRLKA